MADAWNRVGCSVCCSTLCSKAGYELSQLVRVLVWDKEDGMETAEPRDFADMGGNAGERTSCVATVCAGEGEYLLQQLVGQSPQQAGREL